MQRSDKLNKVEIEEAISDFVEKHRGYRPCSVSLYHCKGYRPHDSDEWSATVSGQEDPTAQETIEMDLSRARHEEVAAWIRSARQRDEVIYHVGTYCTGPHRETVRKWSDEGHVVLFQKRIGESDLFKYIARRTAKPCPK